MRRLVPWLTCSLAILALTLAVAGAAWASGSAAGQQYTDPLAANTTPSSSNSQGSGSSSSSQGSGASSSSSGSSASSSQGSGTPLSTSGPTSSGTTSTPPSSPSASSAGSGRTLPFTGRASS